MTFRSLKTRSAERLSALITCWIEIECCKGTVDYPVKLMLRRHPDTRLAEALDKLRRTTCKGKPRAVWLNQIHHRRPAWARRQDGRCGCCK